MNGGYNLRRRQNKTTFSTIDELLDILDNNPRLLEAVRIKILTEDLIRLPHDFAEFKETTNKRFDSIDRRLDENGRRLDDIGGNVVDLKDYYLTQDARTNADYLAAVMGLHWTRTLRKIDILHIWQAAERNGLTGGIPRNDRRSFLHSDIVIDALDSQGNEYFIAVEVSNTIQARDIERVIRNASYLARFTGKPSYMAVTGVSRLEEANEVISEENPQAFDATRGSKVFWLEGKDIG